MKLRRRQIEANEKLICKAENCKMHSARDTGCNVSNLQYSTYEIYVGDMNVCLFVMMRQQSCDIEQKYHKLIRNRKCLNRLNDQERIVRNTILSRFCAANMQKANRNTWVLKK